MTKEIIIEGVNLTSLKERMAVLSAEQAAMRSSIRQGAVKYIAETTELAFAAVRNMRNADTLEAAEFEAAIALEHLTNVQFVANVSGVQFTVPYNSDYDRDEDAITSIFEEDQNEVIGDTYYKERTSPIYKLHSLAESMEEEVREWNTSSC